MADRTIDNLSAAEIEQADIALAADAALPAADPGRFPVAFRTLGATRLGTLKGLIVALNVGQGDQGGAVRRRRLALDRAETFARAIYGFIGGLLPDSIPNPDGTLQTISEADRARLYGAYGFAEDGSLGDFTDARRLALAEQAVAPKAATWPAFWQPPGALVSALASELAVAHTLVGTAAGGPLDVLFGQRDDARDALAAWNGRVRAWVMFGSDLGDQEPRLAVYGHPVRRDAGAVKVDPPAAVGAVTLDTPALLLTAGAGLPPGARSLRAYLEPAGGTPRLAGTSVTATVNLAQLGPVEPGVAYRAWLVGFANESGEGAPSAVVSFTR